MKGIRDRNGIVVDNAHLLGMFNRICKLLHYKIKPVFIFDGGVPALKRQTIENRVRRNQAQLQKNNQKAQKIVKSYLEKQIGKRIDNDLPTIQLEFESDRFSNERINDEMFAITEYGSKKPANSIDQFKANCELAALQDPLAFVDELSEESDDENEANLDLFAANDINVNSKEFEKLPPEIRHNILIGLKEQRKYHGRCEDFYEKDGTNFSKYQIDNMMKGWEITKKVAKVQEELVSLHSGVSKEDFPGYSVVSKNVASESETKILYIKKFEEIKKKETAVTIKSEDYGLKRSYNKPLNQIYGSVDEFDYDKSAYMQKDGSKSIVTKEKPAESLLIVKKESDLNQQYMTLESCQSSEEDDFVEVDELDENSIDNFSFSECDFLLANVSRG